jgi:hypothetical protein
VAPVIATWRELRTKDEVRAGGMVGVVALVLVESIWRKVGSFYTDHPLQAGILTGLLLSFLAYFVVDAIRANLNERRWRPLSVLAFLGLAAETTLVIDTLLWLVTGIEPPNRAAPDKTARRTLRKCRHRHRLA